MDTKQYIGARYVPKFFEYNNGEWLENTQYEPLTIVQYSGNSYTSKKEVPANIGNPSSNPTYWASTGNYNAQVEAYRQEVEAYKQEVDTLSDDVDNLENLTYLGNRKFIFIGDSYNTGEGSWGNMVISRMGLTPNVNVWNSGHGGDCFHNDSFLGQLQTIASNMTSQTKDEITDILVVGAINDALTDATVLVSKVRTFEAYLHTTFTNARFSILLAGWGASQNGMREGAVSNYRWICNSINNGKVYSCYQNLLIPTNIQNDLVHPTSAGMVLIASNCISILNNGETFVDKSRRSCMFKSSRIADSAITLQFYGNNTEDGMVIDSIYPYDGVFPITLAPGVNLTNDWLRIGYNRSSVSVNGLFLKECEFITPAVVCKWGDSSEDFLNTILKVRIIRTDNQGEITWWLEIKNASINAEVNSWTIPNIKNVSLFVNHTPIGYLN